MIYILNQSTSAVKSKSPKIYCNNLLSYSRLNTRVVNIGNLPLGGHHPIRIQSMTNTNTMDTKATIEQSIKLIEAGCEYVRITAQGIKEAEKLAVIKKELIKSGFDNPIIADIHFNPKAAETAARIVEKVRINPGNYSDKKNFKQIEYTDKEYNLELERIGERFLPLLKVCKEYGTAIRIGSNHGSLSDRIMNRYGDTPEGMVESAMEFVRICEAFSFRNIVLSMKASNIKIMIYAYRLLVNKMMAEGMNYPLHLGVTEAGDGDEGRIKSAAGIGALLEDGIGDTIRVSLTEDPVNEIPVAKTIVERYSNRKESKEEFQQENQISPFSYRKRETLAVGKIGGENVPIVIGNSAKCDFKLRELLKNPELNIISIDKAELARTKIEELKKSENSVLIIESDFTTPINSFRKVFFDLIENNCKTPIIIKRNYKNLDKDKFLVYSSADFASLLVDGFGDGICLESDLDNEFITNTSFNILQATGDRISKTEFISCPTCGRTNYDIQKMLKEIKEKCSDFKGLKIAVMGCIVNGPGEMADADYGVVGSIKGKVNIYKKQNVVRKNVDEGDAVGVLVGLINGISI